MKEPMTYAEKLKYQRQNSVADWLDQLEEHQDSCTTWELDFIESISNQYKAGKQLSENKLDVLEQIYNRRT